MKKLLLKLLIVALLVLLPLQAFLFFAPMWYQNTDYVMWKAAWEGCETPSQAIIIGDSRAKAGIMPTRMADDIKSITVGGGTPTEGYYMLKRYLEYNEPPEYIILSYAPFDLQEHGWIWYRTVKYGFLSLQDQRQIVQAYPNSKMGRIKDEAKLILYRVKYPKFYIAELRDFLQSPKKNIEKNKATCARLTLFGGYHWFSKGAFSDELNVEAGYEDFAASPVLNDYLNQMLMLCEQEGIPVYYVTMPMNQASFQALAPEYQKGYAAYLSGLEERYPDFYVLYGLSEDSNDKFSDASHYNQNGAKAFTEKLNQAIKRIRE